MVVPSKRPKALRAGDRVAVVSPAGPLHPRRRAELDRGMELLRSWGLEPELAPHALDENGYLAGTDADRARDLQQAFEDERVRGVLCTRGGYGVTRILPLLDFRPLADDPKPVLGYSDITALLAAIHRTTGVIGLHGPMVATPDSTAMGKAMTEQQRRLLFDTARPAPLPGSDLGAPAHALVAGRGEGELVGGNLTLVCALIGTPWEIATAGRILFLEDVGEAPYRVDRMLTQLRTAGFLDDVAGVWLGDFHEEDTPVASLTPEMARVLQDRLGDLDVPVVSGLPFGHRPESWTLPVGGRAEVRADDPAAVPKLRLLEPAVA